ncbi:uncharacterized protein gng7 isoform X2 [Tachysurus fulvidraco]|uniref:uncharacterized protein gng7 isoform X2 n=1 Tax=Tachysurus fulvidraco TaxID=1234273 RepID=UPI001FEE46F2|nr:uncharacterized protein gng7 isoform X2 [Tachysurus fulvidraco]
MADGCLLAAVLLSVTQIAAFFSSVVSRTAHLDRNHLSVVNDTLGINCVCVQIFTVNRLHAPPVTDSVALHSAMHTWVIYPSLAGRRSISTDP